MATIDGFICYAQADRDMLAAFRTHLASVEKNFGIEFWYDKNINAGELWRDEIGQAIERAKIFLLLLSADWLASDFITNTELPQINAREQVVVIPVLLKRCQYAAVVGDLQVVPHDGKLKPIADWIPPYNGYDQAIIEISTAIRNRLNIHPTTTSWDNALIAEPQNPAGPVWARQGPQFVLVEQGDQRDLRAGLDAATRALQQKLRDGLDAFRRRIHRANNQIGAGWPSLAIAARELHAEVDKEAEDIVARIDRLWRAYIKLEACQQLHHDRRIDLDPQLGTEPLPLDIADDLRALLRVAALFVHQFPTARALDADAPPVDDTLAASVTALLDSAEHAKLIPLAAAQLLHEELGKRRGNDAAGRYAAAGGRNLLTKIAVQLASTAGQPDDVARRERSEAVLAGVQAHLPALLMGFSTSFQEAFAKAVSAQWTAPTVARSLPPPPWAATAGTDELGTWADLSVGAVTQRLRLIPAGTFMMGSTVGHPDELPVHEVTIRDPFWLFDTPCTQELWQAVMGNNPSHFKGPTCPVEGVSCNYIAEFVTKLNARMPGLSLSFPSEAQWEYACRAGSTSERYHEDPDQIAWFADNSGGQTQPVKGKLPNQWGLYDMLGNVWEWCADAWYESYDGAPTDGTARATGAGDRVIRGGDWFDTARYVRAASRIQDGPSSRGNDVGFRLAIVFRASVPGGA